MRRVHNSIKCLEASVQKIGIVGGVAWSSTIEYYRLLCPWSNDHYRNLGSEVPLPTPPIVMVGPVPTTRRAAHAASRF
jgi:hypothetical protein